MPAADPNRHSTTEAYINSTPTKQRPGDQVLPEGGGECVQDRIIAQMQESKRVGVERYGQTLRTFNGRRSIQDAVDEARDLLVYLTQIQMESEALRDDLVSVVAKALAEETGIEGLAARAVSAVIVDRILGHFTGRMMGAQEEEG